MLGGKWNSIPRYTQGLQLSEASAAHDASMLQQTADRPGFAHTGGHEVIDVDEIGKREGTQDTVLAWSCSSIAIGDLQALVNISVFYILVEDCLITRQVIPGPEVLPGQVQNTA